MRDARVPDAEACGRAEQMRRALSNARDHDPHPFERRGNGRRIVDVNPPRSHVRCRRRAPSGDEFLMAQLKATWFGEPRSSRRSMPVGNTTFATLRRCRSVPVASTGSVERKRMTPGCSFESSINPAEAPRTAAGFRMPSASRGLPGSGSITSPMRCSSNPVIGSPRSVAMFSPNKPGPPR